MEWQANVSYATGKAFDEDSVFDLLGELAEHGAVGSIALDFQGGDITLTVEADTALDAARHAITLVTEAALRSVGSITVLGHEVRTVEAAERELSEPLYPEVVGYAEIAEMAQVSRQAARAWADQPSFPVPVIETAQGPLRTKSAVERWLENHPPRRRKMATV